MYIADLHIHSKYSRATSGQCVPEFLDLWARRKGIDLLGTGDFTHPAWRQELKDKLVQEEEGLYVLKEGLQIHDSITNDEKKPRFVISGEISSIYKKNGKTRKVHNLILLPGLEDAELLSRRLEAIGNIHSDGRPILGLDSRDLLEIALDCCPQAIFIPAHIWTPHFSLFGAFSGFDTIEECFEDLTPHIRSLETGLSSDPPMNWRLSALDSYNLVSNSDAHSPAKLGREANLLDIELSYQGLYGALQEGKGLRGTLEFFPEEGKYHMDGHRKCDLCLSPVETVEYGGRCPICGKKITIGVLHRVQELADRDESYQRLNAPHFESLVPLPEVIAASSDMSAASVKVQRQYEAMLQELGSEFSILRDLPLEAIRSSAGPCIEEGIRRLRAGKVKRIPGYDGEYGKIKIIEKEEIEELCGQMTLFGSCPLPAAQKLKQSAKPKLTKKEEPLPERLLSQGVNEKQREAIAAEEAVVAVIAGPGTGKTRTLIERIAFLINERSVEPLQITAVTFTNKAAAEMKSRLTELLGRATAETVTVGTFHEICLKLLREKKEVITIADEQTQLEAAKTTLREWNLSVSPAKFLKEVSKKKSGIPLEDKNLDEACEAYSLLLRSTGFFDFDDLILEALDLVEDAENLRQREYLFVDELQDINAMQYQLMRKWSRGGKNLFVIGDPDQSIYGFRGADAYCFQRMEKDYPKVRRLQLTDNYRSTPQILDCALSVIRKNPGPERFLQSRCQTGEKVRLLEATSDLSEAIFISREINRMTGGMDMMDAQNHALKREVHRSFSDIAVLYRTHHQARLLEKCLQKESIPFTVTGKEGFLEDKIVRATISFFRALLKPSTGQEELTAIGTEIFGNESVKICEYLAPLFLAELQQEKPSQLLEKWSQRAGLCGCQPLQQLREMALFYDRMEEFLDNLLLGEEQDLKRSAAGKLYESGAVSLMTFHAAKGLEFPVVFLCGINEGHLPMKDGETEEERRLFYVGMTRAKEELILMTSQQPSEFLLGIPEQYMKKGEVYKKKAETANLQMNFFDL